MASRRVRGFRNQSDAINIHCTISGRPWTLIEVEEVDKTSRASLAAGREVGIEGFEKEEYIEVMVGTSISALFNAEISRLGQHTLMICMLLGVRAY